MFSATLHSDEVKDIAARICQGATLVDLKARFLHFECSAKFMLFSKHGNGVDSEWLRNLLEDWQCLVHCQL